MSAEDAIIVGVSKNSAIFSNDHTLHAFRDKRLIESFYVAETTHASVLKPLDLDN